jgi:hypothetical protein
VVPIFAPTTIAIPLWIVNNQAHTNTTTSNDTRLLLWVIHVIPIHTNHEVRLSVVYFWSIRWNDPFTNFLIRCSIWIIQYISIHSHPKSVRIIEEE